MGWCQPASLAANLVNLASTTGSHPPAIGSVFTSTAGTTPVAGGGDCSSHDTGRYIPFSLILYPQEGMTTSAILFSNYCPPDKYLVVISTMSKPQNRDEDGASRRKLKTGSFLLGLWPVNVPIQRRKLKFGKCLANEGALQNSEVLKA